MYSQSLSRRCLPLIEHLGNEHHRLNPHFTRNPRPTSVSKRWLSCTIGRHQSINRLSNFWVPTGGIEPSRESQDESHELLLRAGYLRQAHSGVFHMLPLGHRVLHKLEALIDRHMSSIGASKVSLSTISSEDLWRKTGRFVGHGGELFSFKDRKDNKLLLAPTHEEEITSLVASAVQSYKDLPLRLYQISRKYRDEARPRQGLLRGREFIMKDLYTFDHTEPEARQTYERVQAAYRAFFDELKLPYVVARADSGNMGGNLSHEYHFVSPKGEDNVISCGSCGNTINDELAMKPIRETHSPESTGPSTQVQHWCGISKDKTTLVVAWFPRTDRRDCGETVETQVNGNVVKALAPEIDLSVEDPLQTWKSAGSKASRQILEMVDARLPLEHGGLKQQQSSLYKQMDDDNCKRTQVEARVDGQLMQLTSVLAGDACPSCSTGTVQVDRAIEVGHTFHLGTRYSKPLDATVVGKDDQQAAMVMGCHGIGVSRLVGTIASVLSDEKGLNWPASIAPFQAVVVPGKGNEEDAERVYGMLRKSVNAAFAETDEVGTEFDAILDDRNKAMGWKLNDADLVGYPLIVVLGRAWRKERRAEVQCRRLGVREEVDESELAATLAKLLRQL